MFPMITVGARSPRPLGRGEPAPTKEDAMKQWYEELFENYGMKYDHENFARKEMCIFFMLPPICGN